MKIYSVIGVYYDESVEAIASFTNKEEAESCLKYRRESEDNDFDHIEITESELSGEIREEKPKKIEVNTKLGTLHAEAGGDDDYPMIYTYLELPDGTEVDLAAASVSPDGKAVSGYLWGSLYKDYYTNETRITAGELKEFVEAEQEDED